MPAAEGSPETLTLQTRRTHQTELPALSPCKGDLRQTPRNFPDCLPSEFRNQDYHKVCFSFVSTDMALIKYLIACTTGLTLEAHLIASWNETQVLNWTELFFKTEIGLMRYRTIYKLYQCNQANVWHVKLPGKFQMCLCGIQIVLD